MKSGEYPKPLGPRQVLPHWAVSALVVLGVFFLLLPVAIAISNALRDLWWLWAFEVVVAAVYAWHVSRTRRMTAYKESENVTVTRVDRIRRLP